MKKVILLLALGATFSLQIQAQCPPASAPGYHVVQKGETLYRLSIKYNTTVEQLCQLNNIKIDAPLSICQELKVSVGAAIQGAPENAATATSQGKAEHVVRLGETIESIAGAYGYTVERFRQFNQLNSGETIQPGQVLKTTDCACPTLIPDTSPVSMYDQTSAPISNQTNQAAVYEPGVQESGAASIEDSPAVIQEAGAAVKALAPYLKLDESAMIQEINLVRTNPVAYIPKIQAYLVEVRNAQAYGSVEACQELIEELRNSTPIPALEPNECLYNSTRQHVESQRETGAISYLGKDSFYPWDRILRDCPGMVDGNESIISGPSDVQYAVIMLLVDEGFSSRGHRRMLLNKDWKYIACYQAGQVGATSNYWIQEFAR